MQTLEALPLVHLQRTSALSAKRNLRTIQPTSANRLSGRRQHSPLIGPERLVQIHTALGETGRFLTSSFLPASDGTSGFETWQTIRSADIMALLLE